MRSKKFAVKHLVHVARENNRSPALLDLAKDSAVVVTDMVDLEPWKRMDEVSDYDYICSGS